jgi:hypothetical protein
VAAKDTHCPELNGSTPPASALAVSAAPIAAAADAPHTRTKRRIALLLWMGLRAWALVDRACCDWPEGFELLAGELRDAGYGRHALTLLDLVTDWAGELQSIGERNADCAGVWAAPTAKTVPAAPASPLLCRQGTRRTSAPAPQAASGMRAGAGG